MKWKWNYSYIIRVVLVSWIVCFNKKKTSKDPLIQNETEDFVMDIVGIITSITDNEGLSK